jgi:hypothetical protein
VHRHVAPLAPGYTRASLRAFDAPLERTPFFNVDDAVWNNGEGFQRSPSGPADTGGYIGFDDGSGLVRGDIKTETAWTRCGSRSSSPTPASSAP